MCGNDLADVRVVLDWGPPSVLATVGVGRDERWTLLLTHPVPPMGHAATERRNAQLRGLVRQLPHARAVVIGDLNATPWSAAYTELAGPAALHNGRTGRGLQSSWPTYYPALFRTPIDHVLVTTDLVVVEQRLGPDIGSDHLPVIAQVARLR